MVPVNQAHAILELVAKGQRRVITNDHRHRIRLLSRRPADSRYHVFIDMRVPQRACRSNRRPGRATDRGRFGLRVRPLARGDIFAAATARRNSKF